MWRIKFLAFIGTSAALGEHLRGAPHAKGRREAYLPTDDHILEKAINALAEDVRMLKHAKLPNSSAPVEQVLVLTTSQEKSRLRIQHLLEMLPDVSITTITGIDAHNFQSEEEELQHSNFHIAQQQQSDWLNVDLGFGRVHEKHGLNETRDNGMLACVLGHHHMWELAANTSTGRWTVILEDDAYPILQMDNDFLQTVMANVPRNVDEVFLDDRHCSAFGMAVKKSPFWFWGSKVIGNDADIHALGSTAYALTARGARALLAERFQYGADHFLNVPVRSGKINAYCPSAPLFLHSYQHAGTIDYGSQEM